MNRLHLVSPLPPSVNNYLNYRVASNGKKKFVQAYSSKETEIYKRFFSDYVKDQIREQSWKTPEKGVLVYVRMTFYLDRKRKDPNNFLKVPLDVMTDAGAYIDDDVVLPLVERVYIDPVNPRIEIELFESKAIGIFDDEIHLEDFKNLNCLNCKKDPNRCTIMKKLLDNRITADISDGHCLRIKKQ